MAEFDFHEHRRELRVTYQPDDPGRTLYWFYAGLRKGPHSHIRRVLFFDQENLVSRMPDEQELLDESRTAPSPTLRIGRRHDDFYVIDKDVLHLDVELLIHKDVPLTIKSFVAEGPVSIFGRIAELRPKRIVVGGDEEDSIPIREFNRLIAKFPTHTELRKYAFARVSNVVREYLHTQVDGQVELENHLSRRKIEDVSDIGSTYAKFDAEKYRALHARLTRMLKSEEGIPEKTWQNEIVQIICLLNPKYISAFPEARVMDSYADKERRIDFLLVDASGHVDIVEIKRPENAAIVSPTLHSRGSHIPLRELSGTVMQVEKYLFHLTKSGKAGEDKLTKRYGSQLPDGFTIKITNPGGMIIMGRDHNLSREQRQDFEVMRRQYRSVIDIITYDDLLRRLDFVVKQLEVKDDEGL